MAVSYSQTLSVDMIVTEIEALLDWRNVVLRHCFFPAVQTSPPDANAAPATILMWCKRGGESGTIDRNIVERMVLIHDELCKAAQALLDNVAKGEMPTIELYDSFSNQFDGYVAQIRRLHQDVADAGMGVDVVTGLRTASGMRNDLQREQDRFDRKSTPFSITNIEIDKIGDISELDRATQDAIYASVAQLIARTIRSFDDAYFLGKGEYLLVLKHIEFMDACAVMDRMRGEIENAPVFLPTGDKLGITVSCGIAEALQRETPEVALQNAKQALQEAKGAGGNRVQEFRETSALEQYAKDVQGG